MIDLDKRLQELVSSLKKDGKLRTDSNIDDFSTINKKKTKVITSILNTKKTTQKSTKSNKEYINTYYNKNKKRILKKRKENRIKNKEEIKQKRKQYRLNNIEKIREREKLAYEKKKTKKPSTI